MRFHVHKRKQTPAVIIVALVDVLIVLLIFLIVTTTFKQQPALKISLPEVSHAQQAGSAESPPLMISFNDKGQLLLDSQPISVERLQAALLQAVQKNPDIRVAVAGDTNAPWGLGISVVHAIQAAGVKQFGANVKEIGKP